jgi:hypothetical protein
MKSNAGPCLIRLRALPVASLVSALLAGLLSSCGGSSTQAVVTSPTPDAATRNYVALVHNYWIGWQAADGVSNGTNQAAIVCLGVAAVGAHTNMQLIDPAKCRTRAVGLLALHQKFLTDLDNTPAPPKFAADDQAFRSQLPIVITDTKALIAAADTGSKDAVLHAAGTYADEVQATILGALNDVDSSVIHT